MSVVQYKELPVFLTLTHFVAQREARRAAG